MAALTIEDLKKPDAVSRWPAIAALAHGVSYLVAAKPWKTDWWRTEEWRERDPLDDALYGSPYGEEEGAFDPEKRIQTLEEETDEYEQWQEF